MKNKKIFASLAVLLILVALVYIQFRAWRSFDWANFWQQTRGVSLLWIGIAVALIYFAYYLRAVRWAIFLRPIHPTTVRRMVAPQFIGFTALGLFGRAGEFARPYLIARKEGVSFTSQVAVWAVERVFDMGSVLLLIIAFLGMTNGRSAQILRHGARAGIVAVAGKLGAHLWLLLLALAVAAALFCGLWRYARRAEGAVAKKINSFMAGLRTIHDWRSLLAAMAVSILMWAAVSQAYLSVVHAYPETAVTINGAARTSHLDQMKTDDVMLMMCASMFGSMVQLPGVGGGSQLAVISVLSGVFGGEPYNVTPELAVSCGMLLWLVCFMAVIPAGLIMARWEKISLGSLSKESENEAEVEDRQEN
jgi:hypothetical protein